MQEPEKSFNMFHTSLNKDKIIEEEDLYNASDRSSDYIETDRIHT